MVEEKVTISKEYYEELYENSMWLEALEMAGVDNWEGYDDAREIYKQLKSERGDE